MTASTTPRIINPLADRKEKERADNRKMDVTNLARNLFITSAAHGKPLACGVCFELAEDFKRAEEKIYPPEAL